MRDTAPSTPLPGPHVPLANRLLQPASPTVINMDDSLNNTKELQRKSDSTTDESMIENSSAVSLETTQNGDSDMEPMDISKTTVDSSDAHSDCSSPSNNDYKKYFCPICDITLISQHEFTLHIRSHNNDNEIITDKGFTCRICSKVLSSSSSLDRHVLVHSGERPFKCKLCAVTFTTNGNMHRHMRTHTHKPGENYESDGSTDSNASEHSGKSRKRRLEFNNNKLVDNKRKSDCFEDDDNANRRKKNYNNNNNINELQKFHCPVCDREDFASLNVFETHLEDNHPEYEVNCVSCNLSFKNHRALNLHRHMSHNTEQINNINNKAKNAHLGFKDLTFVDFSSEKFPHIARYACEKSLHKPVTTQKFVCDKCVLAFPCSSALQMHQDECLKGRNHLVSNLEYPTDLSRKTSDEEIRRDNFFAHLDLQNKSPPTSPSSVEVQETRPDIKPVIDSKDLADIQSILSMTSNGSLLQHLRSKPQTELIPLPQETVRTPEQHPEEESQDIFAAEFRKMKLRGEFPCRLCTAVFPNLRALKGHNRAHLNGNGNTGPYRCNMCPHSSIDKAALIRHMRTHNGDRPYECSLCNYAFTTKANCERHLRNRHAKTTREEVKKNIIYHPSEDPTNDEINKLNTSRDMKHSFLNSSTEDDVPEKLMNSTPIPKDRITPEIRNLILPQALGITIPPLIPKDLLPKSQSHSPILAIKKDLLPHRLIPKDEKLPFPFPKPPSFSYKVELSEKLEEPKIQIKCLDGLKQIPDYDIQSDDDESNHYDDYPKAEHPIDLSMDVLDLSKKKEQPKEVVDEPQDFTKRTLESAPLHPTSAAQLLLAQQLFKNRFYPNPLSLYQHPTLFPPHPYQLLFPQTFMNTQDIKERMLSLQLSGGNIINDQFSPIPNGLQALHQQAMSKMQDLNYQKDDEIKPPLHINTQLGDSVKLHSPKQKTPDMIHSPNSVKMVIKNGVLMPKQKQRRYRTERPFSCEHCSARFTLRSNMERHIKQQHPQFWSQRQRSGITPTGRKPTPPQTSTKPPFYELNVPNYDLNIPKLNDSLVNETKDMMQISQQVKYAILAQKLKAHNNDSNLTQPSKDEDEDALIIDEELSRSEVHPMDFSNDHKPRSLDEKMLQLRQIREKEMKLNEEQRLAVLNHKPEEVGSQDLVPVSRLLDNAVSSQLPFREYFRRDGEENEVEGVSEEDEEGLVASGSTSEGNGSGSDENKSENETPNTESGKKKSAYSLAPNRVSCPYCHRKFPWTSSLRRHVLTHTGQKPFKCSQCPLLFTTKSNCDRHLLRKHGNSSNPETTSNNNNNNNSSNQNYMMRNVPERPYKCSSCPSSTFSTLSNLKKHMSCKHTDKIDDVRPPSRESFASSEDERKSENKSDWESQISQSKLTIPNSELGSTNSDLPFKCHLCECSYADRQEALDHIKDNHCSEFELLMAKGALDQNPTEELPTPQDPEDDGDLRGKFPDYANRKVMCAFCMRRFWSAEDLRRHMRTHTGERPFSCDICNRRFTLKHSMLRHRKKHNLTNNDENLVSGDEEHYDKLRMNNNNNVPKSSEEDSGAEGNDLIGNLLGIRDKSIIDQVLVSSADDAAKLLGVNHGVNE